MIPRLSRRSFGVESAANILAPYALEEFLASSWGVSFLHVRGGAGKFALLMPWERLNQILQRHRLDYPRLRLAKDGTSLPASSFLRHVGSARRKTNIPRLLPVELMKHLRDGATLVLDAVDELHEPIEQLASGLELFFREHVQVNLYAGWQTSRGFDVHWDDHDVFILQVAGRKRWSIYGMTRPHPLVADVERAEKPKHDPLWEGTLEDGDLLYIPRGWWHVATPLAESTLHLTVGVNNRTGLDLVRWLADGLRAKESFRRDLPRFASPAERSAHAENLRQEFLNAWDDSIVERFYAELDAQAEPRAKLRLPWAASPRRTPLSPRARVYLLAPRPLNLETNGEVIEVRAMKKRWRFAADALAVLRPLAERRVCTIAELYEATRDKLDERTVSAFVDELSLNGFVSVEEA